MTTKDIARLCGVSRGTVDRAINDRLGINPETKKKILDSMRLNRYRPDLIARGLSTGRTKMIGIVVFNVRNQFFSQLINSIGGYVRERGFFIQPAFTEHEIEAEAECLTRLCSLNVDGIILFPVNGGREYEQFLRSLNRPIVTVGNRVSSRWPFAGIDDLNAMQDAVHFIASRGYQDVVYVSPPLANPRGQNIYEVEQRFRGFRQGIKEALGVSRPAVINSEDYLERAVGAIRNGSGRRTAILCSSDIYALRILKRFRAEGIAVPRDAGLMGFDNLEVLEYVQPALATVDYHIAGIGEAAARLMLGLIEGDEEYREPVLIRHTVVPGESL